ncbi:hypothetical protein CEUSTIGMA_g1129.t1 [Chlamydomonas eustigma]|uniref:SET domain-containing protein n=1 Tax=Chlamydomonas eustigma TaxID=1157962 RepID=A0A250WS79_9CHLO|nr:hypothetical protein CEUSTIGMA_g1129.t1 [Chlamydomonas eustigma]|eukprot:GAX73678.1 hypothetical protein CEUSTIGMA_g1129.t1 [Chlamydomonas eustigma]
MPSHHVLADNFHSVPNVDAKLRKWVVQNGGYIHDGLCLSDNAPCGARGVVALSRISLDDMLRRPLVSIPKTLHLDNLLSTALVKSRVSTDVQHELVEGLEQVQIVAAALASERSLGTQSSWYPYIESLPEAAPCPWLLSDEALDHAVVMALAANNMHDDSLILEPYQSKEDNNQCHLQNGIHYNEAPGSVSRKEEQQLTSGCSSSSNYSNTSFSHSAWKDAAKLSKKRYQMLGMEVLDICGRDLNLSLEDIIWAMGQVASRSLGSGRSSGVVPYMDLLNHHAEARPPMLQVDESYDHDYSSSSEQDHANNNNGKANQGNRLSMSSQPRLLMTCTNVRGMELCPLEVGQELYISYGEWETSLEAWLKFGFILK